MIDPEKLSVGINVTYWIQGTVTEVCSKTFDGSDVEEARIGLPVGFVPTKAQPGEYNYSQVHDSGELPPLRENGSLCKLLSCLFKGKDFNDNFLTIAINKERMTCDSNPPKRPKI